MYSIFWCMLNVLLHYLSPGTTTVVPSPTGDSCSYHDTVIYSLVTVFSHTIIKYCIISLQGLLQL